MNLNPLLLASALMLTPLAATAQAADCGGDITALTKQIDAAGAPAPAQAGQPSPELSAWTVTWNRMATAAENAYAATLAPGKAPGSGAQGGLAAENVVKDQQQIAFPTGRAHTLAQARDALQVARAAHARGDEATCARQIADARQLLDSIS